MAGPITRENSAAYRARAMEVKRLKAEQRKRERKLLDSLLIRFASEPPEPRLEPREKFQRRIVYKLGRQIDALVDEMGKIAPDSAERIERIGRAAESLAKLVDVHRKLSPEIKPAKSGPVAPEEYGETTQ